MNKICTTVKQSRKLMELGIDVNTADMRYMYRHWEIDENTVGAQSDATIGFDSDFYYGADNGKTYHYIPCWSLAALLNILAKESPIIKVSKRNGEYQYNIDIPSRHCKIWFSSMLDAVFEMICWLLESKKI